MLELGGSWTNTGKGFSNGNITLDYDTPGYYSFSLGSDKLDGILGYGGPTYKFPKGMEEHYKNTYPAFYKLVIEILPRMVNDKNFMKALSVASGFSIEELNDIFQYGKGAILQDGGALPFGDAEYVYGRIKEKSLINTINVDEKVLEWFEKADKNSKSLTGVTNTFYMIMLLGHETSHWGDEVRRESKFGVSPMAADFAGEVGYFFEYRTMRKNFPDYENARSGLNIGHYGNKISGVLKNFVFQNFQNLSNIISK